MAEGILQKVHLFPCITTKISILNIWPQIQNWFDKIKLTYHRVQWIGQYYDGFIHIRCLWKISISCSNGAQNDFSEYFKWFVCAPFLCRRFQAAEHSWGRPSPSGPSCLPSSCASCSSIACTRSTCSRSGWAAHRHISARSPRWALQDKHELWFTDEHCKQTNFSDGY